MKTSNQNVGSALGVVVIGRNEGERLRKCLVSVLGEGPAQVVYVDSGSTDGSTELARSLGVGVVELDMSLPFSAARGRNAGFEHLRTKWPDISRVQFVDGDCELRPNWLSTAMAALDGHDKLAIVAGWLHERSPEASIYNRIADLEWNFAGAGDIDAVGGIFMVRAEAFAALGGFDISVAAGEEPELCARLRRSGWRLRRLDADMATHDLAMMHFAQWWRRVLRYGYCSLDVATRFGLAQFGRANWRARVWGGWLAAAAGLLLAAVTQPSIASALVLGGWLLLWPAQCARIAWRTARAGTPYRVAGAYAFFVLLSNFPHLVGQAWCWLDRRRGRQFRLVEHKTAVAAAGGNGRGGAGEWK